MQQVILDFFDQVLHEDSETLDRVAKFDGFNYDNKNKTLQFKLCELHEFFENELSLSYGDFIQLIYRSTLNEALQALGGRVEIHLSKGNIKDNIYRLVKLDS